MKTYILINLDDFHENQVGSKTSVGIHFVQAGNLTGVRGFASRWYPENSWVAIPKQYFDEHIIFKSK